MILTNLTQSFSLCANSVTILFGLQGQGAVEVQYGGDISVSLPPSPSYPAHLSGYPKETIIQSSGRMKPFGTAHRHHQLCALAGKVWGTGQAKSSSSVVLQGTEFECAWKAALGLKFSCCAHELEEEPKPKKRPARVLRKLHTNKVLTCDPSDLL